MGNQSDDKIIASYVRGMARNKPICLAIGTNCAGTKEVLGPSECTSYRSENLGYRVFSSSPGPGLRSVGSRTSA